jgi:hypothetical protein
MTIIVGQLKYKGCIGCNKKDYCWIIRSESCFHLIEKCQCLICLVKPMCNEICEKRSDLRKSFRNY